jgi:hypothetical protein
VRVRRADDDVVRAVETRGRQRVADRRRRQGRIGLGTEALLPHPTDLLVRQPPAVEELRGGGRGAGDLRDDVVAAPERERGATVAAVALVGRCRPPGPDVGEDGETA